MIMALPRSHKYWAKPCEIDGHKFPSQKEGRRYLELKLLERAGAISGLELQPKFPLIVNGAKICEYRGDFRYVDGDKGAVIIEDTKGFKTPEYRLKKKLVEALYGISILES